MLFLVLLSALTLKSSAGTRSYYMNEFIFVFKQNDTEDFSFLTYF